MLIFRARKEIGNYAEKNEQGEEKEGGKEESRERSAREKLWWVFALWNTPKQSNEANEQVSGEDKANGDKTQMCGNEDNDWNTNRTLWNGLFKRFIADQSPPHIIPQYQSLNI